MFKYRAKPICLKLFFFSFKPTTAIMRFFTLSLVNRPSTNPLFKASSAGFVNLSFIKFSIFYYGLIITLNKQITFQYANLLQKVGWLIYHKESCLRNII